MNNKYWVAFSSIEEIGSRTIEKLYQHFNDIEKAFNCNKSDLKQIEGLNKNLAEKFLTKRDKLNPDKCLEEVTNRGIKILTLEDENYPKLLREISNPPAVLYYKGNLNRCNFDRNLAVVGSRKASTNGKQSLKRIIDELKDTDICIVSGLALGIDTCAHNLAIENNLATIGVIASGFDYIYPSQNKELYRKIEEEQGVIFTEYYPTFKPISFRFPQRNRIVTGLSKGTLVVEAAIKSGALISANLTLEQGRELMCIPGAINNPNTEGIYKLLKNGATMITEANDILEALNWEIQSSKTNNDEKFNNLNDNEKCIIEAIKIEPLAFDTIQSKTKLQTDELLTCLTMLELKGIIIQVDGDRYSIC